MHKKINFYYYIPYSNTVGADNWIYRGFKNASQNLNLNFKTITANSNLKDYVDEKDSIFFFNAKFEMRGKYLKEKIQYLEKIKKNNTIFLGVDWFPLEHPESMSTEDIKIFREYDLANIYFGERENQSMLEFEKVTNKKYYLIPNAADKSVHFKADFNKKYNYDVIFIGAKLPKKKFFFENILIPLSKKYNVGIFGPYWTVKDNSLRIVTKYLRKFNMIRLNNYFNNLRITIPYENERDYYFNSKICINFHEKENKNYHYHKIINQRTFKIAACAGLQIIDDIDNINNYFNKDEIVTANSTQDWFDKIEYFINNEKERNDIREKSFIRCHRDHLYENRLKEILELSELN